MGMIVVVHCNADSRKCLVRLLQISGFDAAAFANGIEALAAMRRQKPRLLLLNGSLSDMDGLELLREVRADEVLADLPVGFMSGNYERQPEAERLGIAGYLLKPTATKDFLDFVQQALCVSLV
jgi:CheY-like chemotaxis protein